MTSVTVLSKHKEPAGFLVSGHSGYGESGTDIVCAALSSAVQLTMIAITDILNLDTNVSIDSDNAVIEYRLPDSIGSDSKKTVDTVLKAFERNCMAIAEEYPEAIQILYSEVES